MESVEFLYTLMKYRRQGAPVDRFKLYEQTARWDGKRWKLFRMSSKEIVGSDSNLERLVERAFPEARKELIEKGIQLEYRKSVKVSGTHLVHD